jgi:hypothetical protein
MSASLNTQLSILNFSARWPAASYEFRADIAALYGEKLFAPLTAAPASAFITDGSFVTVYRRGDSEDA